MIRHNHFAIWSLVFFQFLFMILWYSPLLFSYSWNHELGFDKPGYRPNDNLPYVSMVVAYVIVFYFISWLVQVLKKDSFMQGLKFGLLLFLGFAGPLVFARYKHINMPLLVTLIDLGFVLILILVSTSVLAAWRKEEN